MSNKPYCRTSINYSVSLEDRVAGEIDVYDGRAHLELSWQHNGFELLSHRSEVSDWDDHRAVREVYYGEMETLARELSGARVAIISSHINRNPDVAAKHADYGPIQFVHSDFGDDYGEFLRAYYQEDDPHAQLTRERHGLTKQDFVDAQRVILLQFWRNVGEPVMDMPLVLCDSRSVCREDLLQFKMPGYGGNGRAFDAFVVKPPRHDAHRWYTFTPLSQDEVIVIRTFDSAAVAQGEPYWTPHSAIHDPMVVAAAPRRSIEVRAMCLF
ncbi:MAG: CmcJ/NvfI family oxidoreductase [Pseudomonadota bacterium]